VNLLSSIGGLDLSDIHPVTRLSEPRLKNIRRILSYVEASTKFGVRVFIFAYC
jgi:hypothetical protein